jgi:hypothetical protein
VRDVTANEDRCRVRSGARALAVIRNLILHLIRARGMSARFVSAASNLRARGAALPELRLLRNTCRMRSIGAVFFHEPDSRYTNVIIVDHEREGCEALA